MCKLQTCFIKKRLQAFSVGLNKQHVTFAHDFIGGRHSMALFATNQSKYNKVRFVSGTRYQAVQSSARMGGVFRNTQLGNIFTNTEQLAASRVVFPAGRKTPADQGN